MRVHRLTIATRFSPLNAFISHYKNFLTTFEASYGLLVDHLQLNLYIVYQNLKLNRSIHKQFDPIH